MIDITFVKRIFYSQHLSSLNDISEMKEAVEMLVLPIKTLLGHYIYGANRNEMLAVGKDLFNYISEVQAGKVGPASYKSDHEFQLLQSRSYSCDSPLQNIVYPSNDLGGEEGNKTMGGKS